MTRDFGEHGSSVDRIIRRGMAEGQFDNLAGAGKPLSLDDENPLVPAELRLAFKIMRDANVAPTWIDLGRGIGDEIQALQRDLGRHRVRMQSMRSELGRVPAQDFRDAFARAMTVHVRERGTFLSRLADLQKDIERFCVYAPDRAARPHFNPQALLESFDACWPWNRGVPADERR